MLAQLRLQNFRCFDDHVVPIRNCTAIVGKNNAGKSTLVDALRLVSIASARFFTLALKPPVNWGNVRVPLRELGIAPSIEGMEFNTENLFHRNQDPPATIEATFVSGAMLRIYLGPAGKLHAVLLDRKGAVVKDRARAREVGLPRVEIMPQVAPVERKEEILGAEYVRRNLSSALAPRHFRNQINLMPDRAEAFRRLAADTWHGLQVLELMGEGGKQGEDLALLVRNDDYVAELSAMGHGLQMWLQTMWFLARIESDATVILDEPDVYMHPDLQRRLIRYLRQHRPQVILTTHSVEIMSEVSPEQILVLDRQHATSTFAASFPAAQQVLDSLGSAHNLQLARLWHTRRSLFVEGNDFRLLADVFDVLFPTDQDGLTAVPYMAIGGWAGWQNAVGSSMLLRNSGGQNIAVYCVLDSDFHTPAQKSRRYDQASKSGIKLHIWKRKEIENYLLVPSALQRVISARIPKGKVAPTLEEVEERLGALLEIQRDTVIDSFANEFFLDDRSSGIAAANQAARNLVLPLWTKPEGKLALSPGKIVFTQVARWSQDTYGVSLNPALVARSLRANEVASELFAFLSAVASGRDIPAAPSAA
jgi:predicted ATPase